MSLKEKFKIDGNAGWKVGKGDRDEDGVGVGIGSEGLGWDCAWRWGVGASWGGARCCAGTVVGYRLGVGWVAWNEGRRECPLGAWEVKVGSRGKQVGWE